MTKPLSEMTLKRAVACTCLTDVCDCQSYPTHVSEECPIHNRKPMPADTCPVHGTFNVALEEFHIAVIDAELARRQEKKDV